MLVIPAIDLKGGRCVRLRQGIKDQETVYSDDPADVARRWKEAGAELIHVVDLDGAFEGKPRNLPVVKKILKAVDVPVQLGGGIRDMKTIEGYIGAGVARVVLGTAAQRDPTLLREATREFEGRIAASIDARDGMVAVEGWVETTAQEATELAMRMEEAGVSALIYTDISRDGMQSGVNVEAVRRLAQVVETPVIAAGGVHDIEDVRQLIRLEGLGVEGMITGRAIYEGTLDLAEAIALAKHQGKK